MGREEGDRPKKKRQEWLENSRKTRRADVMSNVTHVSIRFRATFVVFSPLRHEKQKQAATEAKLIWPQNASAPKGLKAFLRLNLASSKNRH